MSRPPDIDDCKLTTLTAEISRRVAAKRLGRCAYCAAPLNRPGEHTCKWADKLQEYVQDADPLRVVEGGERLYAYPFAYYGSNLGANQFHYILSESYPYPHDQLATNDRCGRHLQESFRQGLREKFRWWLALGLGKRLWALRYRFGEFRRMFGWKAALTWKLNYEDIGVFLATNVPGIRLHLPRQLLVEDDRRFTETFYLIPTDNWVEKQLETVVPTANHVEERDAYLRWRKRWSFCDIGFLLVLDT